MVSTDTSISLEAEIRTFLDSWQDSLRTKDSAAHRTHYLSEGVGFDLAPPLAYTSGNDQHQKTIEEWFSGFNGPLGYVMRDLSISVSGDTAYCHFLNQLSATTAGGEQFSIWYRVTLGLKRVDGSWKIAHEHESVPFYMDGSFKAAVDLIPE